MNSRTSSTRYVAPPGLQSRRLGPRDLRPWLNNAAAPRLCGCGVADGRLGRERPPQCQSQNPAVGPKFNVNRVLSLLRRLALIGAALVSATLSSAALAADAPRGEINYDRQI